MTTPAIITVAITGAVPTTRDNPAVPVVPEQQVISAVEAYEAGATVCHVHVRDAEELPASDPALYDEVRTRHPGGLSGNDRAAVNRRAGQNDRGALCLS